jgi:DNA-binding CsgD family transcriptional regulator
MTLRHRPMQPRDLRPCVEKITSDPVRLARYGKAIEDLHPAWLRLLECEAKSAIVFEEVDGSRATLCGIGVSAFVNDDFMRELKARPCWYGPELARRLSRGDSPILSDRQLREANSRGGLNVVVWEAFICPGFETNLDVYRKMGSGFIKEHLGFFWKELLAHQVDTVDRLHWMLQTGGLVWDPVAGHYTDLSEKDPAEIVNTPHVFGLTREVDMRRPGSWIGILFEYRPPQFGFSPAEQRLLLAALNGGTDRELSGDLGISLATVKKTWRSIYDRVAARSPDLIPSTSAADGDEAMPERGREKKHPLIAYLRQHPEELRPFSRKPLKAASHAPVRQEAT